MRRKHPLLKRPSHFLGLIFGLGSAVLMGGCASLGRLYILPGMNQGIPAGTLPPSPDYELLSLRTADGTRIAAQFGRALDATGQPLADYSHRPTMIFFYGMRHTVASGGTQMLFGEFRRLGANVLIPDFPGYGMSAGSASEESFYATADAALDHLLGRPDIDHGRIFAAGWSLGTAPAVDLASRRQVAGLLLIGAFTTAHDMGLRLLPNTPEWLVSSLFASCRFDNLAKIPAVKCPILLVQGAQDTMVLRGWPTTSPAPPRRKSPGYPSPGPATTISGRSAVPRCMMRSCIGCKLRSPLPPLRLVPAPTVFLSFDPPPEIKVAMSDLPPEFSAALKQAGLDGFFADCTPAHRREYLQWITSAKRPETKSERIRKAVKMLADKHAQETNRPSRRS